MLLSKQKSLRTFLSGKESMGELSSRRALTTERIVDLRSNLKSAEKLIRGNACVYMTGSFGRGEASAHSDLDLFILGKGYGRDRTVGKRKSKLSRLN
jgi:predicted nucleotidyltransferase